MMRIILLCSFLLCKDAFSKDFKHRPVSNSTYFKIIVAKGEKISDLDASLKGASLIIDEIANLSSIKYYDYLEFRKTRYTLSIKNGTASIRFNQKPNHYYHAEFFSNGTTPTVDFLIKGGDSLVLEIKSNKIAFFGNNTNTAFCFYQLKEQMNKFPQPPENPEKVQNYFNLVDSTALSIYARIDSFESTLSKSDYLLIRSYAHMECQSLKLGYQNVVRAAMVDSVFSNLYSSYLIGYTDKLSSDDLHNVDPNSWPLINSTKYLDFLFRQCFFQRYILAKKQFTLEDYYSFLCQTFKGQARQYLIYQLVKTFLQTPTNIGYCINDAQKKRYVYSPDLNAYLNRIKRTLPGSQALDFALPNLQGKIVKLSDLRGKVVLIDTWHMGCGACQQTHPYLDSIKTLLSGKNFEIVSLFNNSDGIDSKAIWRQLCVTDRYTSENNINVYLGPEKKYWTDFYQIIGDPFLLLIDKEGKMLPRPVSPRSDGGKNLMELINRSL